MEGPHRPRRPRLEDHPAKGIGRTRIPHPQRLALPDGHERCPLPAPRPHPGRFDLSSHENEGKAALAHLQHAAEGDIIAYDRGFRSLAMAQAHRRQGKHFVFRIARNTSPALDAVINSDDTDRTADIGPPKDQPPEPAIPVRLFNCTHADTEYCLATSLPGPARYPIPALSDLQHGRRGIEGLCKTGQAVIGHYHAKSERGVRQETHAAFTLVAPARQFANRCDADINDVADEENLPDIRTNFSNGLRPGGREIEAMFLQQSRFIARSVGRNLTGLSRCIQRERPGQSHPRESKRPRSKWTRKSST